MEVEYVFSGYPGKTAGYHSINKNTGKVKIFYNQLDLDYFVEDLIYTILLERICLERAFNKIRMKNRCQPVCKIAIITEKMLKGILF